MKYNIYYFDPSIDKMLDVEKQENGKEVKAISSLHNFVFKGDLLAKTVAAETEDEVQKYLDQGKEYSVIKEYTFNKPGNGVQYFEDRRSYVAERYGFVVINNLHEIEILPPFEITKQKIAAYIYLLSGNQEKALKVEDIQALMSEQQIIYVKSTDYLTQQINNIDHQESKIYRVKVAEGKEPQNGNPDLYECLIDLHKRAGKILEDGSIDFKELNSVIEVKKGTKVMEHFPAVENVDGVDVYGNVIKAEMNIRKTLTVGENLAPSPVPGESNYYVSQIDGCVVKANDQISINDVLTIYSDVDYETGNLNVMGSVVIKGDVKPGFEVKAGGDILIEGNCDDALIEAGGSVTVHGGILGHGNSDIKSKISVFAKFAVNAKIRAFNLVEIQDSIINCQVVCDHAIVVTDQNGRIMGGEYVAKYLICAHYIGSENESKTTLILGTSPRYEKEYSERKAVHTESATILAEEIQSVTALFGKDALKNPKKTLIALPQSRKQKFALMLNGIIGKNKLVKANAEAVAEIEKKMRLRKAPIVNVLGAAYSGVDIYIKKLKRVIDKKIEYCSFYVDENHLIAFREAQPFDLEKIESFSEKAADAEKASKQKSTGKEEEDLVEVQIKSKD